MNPLDNLTEREIHIINELTDDPQTIYEVAEKIGVGHQSVRNVILSLEDRGFLKEATWRQGRQKVWCVADNETARAIRVFWGKTQLVGFDIIERIAATNSVKVWGEEVAGVLSYLALRSFYKTTNQENMMPQTFNEEDLLQALNNVILGTQRFTSFLQQLVTSVLFSKPEQAWERLGSPAFEDLLKYASDWEQSKLSS